MKMDSIQSEISIRGGGTVTRVMKIYILFHLKKILNVSMFVFSYLNLKSWWMYSKT